MILQYSQPEVLGSRGLNVKVHSPVCQDSEEGTEEWANPVNPMVAREMAIDNGRTKRASWVDAGCVKRCISKWRLSLGCFTKK
jgi:hypothetical protein